MGNHDYAKGNNTVTHSFSVNRAQRMSMKGHRSFLILLTGLSGSGKSTLANALELRLLRDQVHTYILDGDNIRKGINRNLGFSPEDRSENNRRIGEISRLFVDAGIVVVAAFICPYKKDRENMKRLVGPSNFFEVFLNTGLEECERRDPKGLYKKARAGKITNMTGISAPYEAPEFPNLEILPEHSIETSVEIVYKAVSARL